MIKIKRGHRGTFNLPRSFSSFRFFAYNRFKSLILGSSVVFFRGSNFSSWIKSMCENWKLNMKGIISRVLASTTHLCEIIRQMKYLPYLLRRFSFDYSCKCTTCKINQRSQLKAVGSRCQVTKPFGIHPYKFLVMRLPFLYQEYPLCQIIFHIQSFLALTCLL